MSTLPVRQCAHSDRETDNLPRNKAAGTGGNATAQRDSTGQADKIKQEHPEAPDAIGLQDERGRAK